MLVEDVVFAELVVAGEVKAGRVVFGAVDDALIERAACGPLAGLAAASLVIGNVIAIMAARRACINYARHCFGVPLRWDKTVHHIVPAPSVRPE